ncbi:MAG: hypothetical protein ABI067_07055 [Leifsonia sp.]
MKAKPEIAHGCTEIYGYRIHCLGCNDHIITTVGDKTKSSLLVRTGKFVDPNYEEDEALVKAGLGSRNCHSFITDGKIKYLSDCNHHLAGQTIDLPKIE